MIVATGPVRRSANAQVQYLIGQFDGNIYPKEAKVFSTPPNRTAELHRSPTSSDLPANYYRGDGDDIAVLIDNVRDANFYDTDNQSNLTYIAGFLEAVSTSCSTATS